MHLSISLGLVFRLSEDGKKKVWTYSHHTHTVSVSVPVLLIPTPEFSEALYCLYFVFSFFD